MTFTDELLEIQNMLSAAGLEQEAKHIAQEVFGETTVTDASHARLADVDFTSVVIAEMNSASEGEFARRMAQVHPEAVVERIADNMIGVRA